MIFSSVLGGSGFILGTYTAQDYDLSEAEKYYTRLARDMNQKILKVGTDDWKKGLQELGIDTGGMKTKLDAARICLDCGCDMVITNGDTPAHLYDIVDGKSVGTRFEVVR
jgi:glutamate 5-kinase